MFVNLSLMRKRYFIYCVAFAIILPSCFAPARSLQSAEPLAISRLISSESNGIANYRSQTYSSEALGYLTPSLRAKIEELIRSMARFRKVTAQDGLYYPELNNMPNDLILLRNVALQSEEVIDSHIAGSQASVVIREVVKGDGKVYSGYKGQVKFEFTLSRSSWLLSDVEITRGGEPFRLTQFLDKQITFFRSK
jgi:hypothetical protein